MNKPLITAIIPTYKRPKWLRRAVRSVLAQTFPDFQVLIADNASGAETDACVHELMQQDARVTVLKHTTNIGAPANFLEALKQVVTPYVCFLPDDDFLLPTFFEETLSIFARYPDIVFCGGGALLINPKYEVSNATTSEQNPASGYYAPPSGLFTYMKSANSTILPAILFNTELVRQAGGFDVRLCGDIDVDLITKCALRFPIYLLPDRPMYFSFQHGGSLSLTLDFFAREKERLIVHNNLLSTPVSSKVMEELELFLQQQRLKLLSSAYENFCSDKDFAKARLCAEKIYSLIQSGKWKRKGKLAALYAYFPFLRPFYIKLKALEKSLRSPGKQKELPKPEVQHSLHPKSAFWKEYVLTLEAEM